MYVVNKEPFGHMLVPLEKGNTLQNDQEQLLNLKIEMMGRQSSSVSLLYTFFLFYFLKAKYIYFYFLVEQPQIYVSPSLEHYVEKAKQDTLGFDQVK